MKKAIIGFLLVFAFIFPTYSQTFSLHSGKFSEGSVLRTYSVLYDLGKMSLNPDCFPFLDSIAVLMKSNPALSFSINEFTDFRGDATANLVLSQGRARNVLNYLVTAGVEPGRLRSEGYGETIPLETESEFQKRCGGNKGCDGNPCKQLNRRTEISITAIKQ
jgi:outer membrane protein OmpA-like peptidoglycan-associated protein